MNADLKNRTLINEAVVKKSMTRALHGQRINLFCDALLAIGYSIFCMIVYGLHFPDFLSIISVLLLVLGIAIAIRGMTLPHKMARLTMRRVQEQYQADSYEVAFTFSDEAIQMQSSVQAKSYLIFYDSIKKILLCDDLIVLKSKTKLLYSVDRNRFENGDEGDFRLLMNKKCPKAVPREYRC